MRAEQLPETSSKENIMAQAITFTQTRTVEVLDAAGLTADQFTEFLDGTGWKVTRTDSNSLGVLHEAHMLPASPNRRMFGDGDYIVKVDGKVAGPVPKEMFTARYTGLVAA
jgi:hypothetical protein